MGDKRSKVFPAEKQLTVPQFVLQASATPVLERMPSKRELFKKPKPITQSKLSRAVELIYPLDRQSASGSKPLSAGVFATPVELNGRTVGICTPDSGLYSKDGSRSHQRHSQRDDGRERVDLERQNLVSIPHVEGVEETLKIFNLQRNSIERITGLDRLTRLVCLDLYDNHLERVEGLEGLASLRILLLGKNRIKKIENLSHLVNLDMLDLHNNQITILENLENLHDLRVLNLSGNFLAHVEGVSDLASLTELNLKKNRIRSAAEVNRLPSLEKLHLSYNKISKLEDISCVLKCSGLIEICLDNNPLYNREANVKAAVLVSLQKLKILDLKRVTEEQRKQAELWCRKDEEKRKESSKMAALTLEQNEKRHQAILNARKKWQNLRSQSSHMVMPDLVARHLASIRSSRENDRSARSDSHDENSARISDVGDYAPAASSTTSGMPSSRRDEIFPEGRGGSTGDSRMSSGGRTDLDGHGSAADGQSARSGPDDLSISGRFVVKSKTQVNGLQQSRRQVDALKKSGALSKGGSPNDEDKAEENGIFTTTTTTLVATNSAVAMNKNACRTMTPQTLPRVRRSSRSKSVNSAVLLTDGEKVSKEKVPESNHRSLTAITTNPDSLSELDGETLKLFGSGSLDAFDRNWGIQAAGVVTTAAFSFIDFDEIVRVLPKIRVRFPSVCHLTFNSTNVSTLNQLNALAQVKRLESLCIESEENPVTLLTWWRLYAIFRLAHLGLKKINGEEITSQEFGAAERAFSGMSSLVASTIPKYRLHYLLGDKKKLLADDKNNMSPCESRTPNCDKVENIAKAIFNYDVRNKLGQNSKDPNHKTSSASSHAVEPRPPSSAKLCLDKQMTQCLELHKCLNNFDRLWPDMLRRHVHRLTREMLNVNKYSEKSMKELCNA